MSQQAIIDLLYHMADDALIIGHRNSEWTGIGPTIEEDIAFSSMAQDKIGHAYNLYQLLHNHFGQGDPDTIAFKRKGIHFTSCHFVELPIGDYAFSLVRHFLFDHAEMIRYTHLLTSSFTPLAQLSAKIRGEIKYHLFHANTWIQQLGQANEQSRLKLQTALNEIFPYAIGMFEATENEAYLQTYNLTCQNSVLQKEWLTVIQPVLNKANLLLPNIATIKPIYGGRKGHHTKHLSELLKEMGTVLGLDLGARW